MLKRNTLKTIAVCAVLVSAGGLLTACSKGKPEFRGVDISEVDYARDIQLPDHNGQQRSLKDFKGKVVVVFWGDHQPFFPSKFNDKWFTGEDDATHQERLWQTDYIIWANYDVAGCDQTSEVDDLSTNYLSTQLMQLIGAPLSDYQKAHMTLRESLPAINSVGYEDASLRWALSSNVTGDDAAAAAATKAREDYAKMQYYEMFRDGKNVYTEHFQTEANETDPNLAPGTTKIK